MRYKNAKEILPEYLLIEIMKYIGEGLVYFPAPSARKSWGSLSGFRSELKERNKKIRIDYENGTSIGELEIKYYLSQSSLYRIIKNK